jgi:hypothetical protein
MTIEAWRYGLTAFSATLAPFAVAAIRARSFTRASAAVVISLIGLAPALSTVSGWVFLVALMAFQLAIGPSAQPLPRRSTERENLRLVAASRWRESAVALAVVTGVAGAVLAQPEIVERAWEEVTAPTSAVMLITSAVLAATLAWGVVVETAISLFSARMETLEEGVAADRVRHAGRLIGWLERSLIVAGIAAGKPELLAVVVAVKSIARLQEFKDETFAEYFLIGTLLSLAGAILAGGLVRLVVFGELS